MILSTRAVICSLPLLVAATMLVSSCSLTGSGSASAVATITIGTSFPETLAEGSEGLGARQAVQLAVQQANSQHMVPGFTLVVRHLDDATTRTGDYDPYQEAANAGILISDPNVAGVIGPYNSAAAEASSPIYNQASMAQISPSATDPVLTDPAQAATYRPNGRVTFFRVCTTDAYQGPLGADYAYNKLNARTAFVLNDGSTYGVGLAQSWATTFAQLGGKVADTATLDPHAANVQAVIAAITQAKPDLVYYGGNEPAGAALAQQAVSAHLQFMGGDGVQTNVFINLATPAAANGWYATFVGPDFSKVPTAQAFLMQYQAAFGTPAVTYGPYAYDAANIMIQAIARAVKAGAAPNSVAFREAVREQVAATNNFQGVTGTTTFDQNGDTTNHFISIWQVSNGAWGYLGPAQTTAPGN